MPSPGVVVSSEPPPLLVSLLPPPRSLGVASPGAERPAARARVDPPSGGLPPHSRLTQAQAQAHNSPHMAGTVVTRQNKLPSLYPRRPTEAQAELREATQDLFLKHYADLGTIRHASAAADIAVQTHYDWLEAPEYAEKWAAAQEQFVEHLEREAARRAVDGQEVGVYFQGERVGVERRPSDNLLMFLLKGRRPEVYKDRQEITGAGGGPVQVQAVRADALARLSGEELAVLLRLNPGVAPRALPDGSQADADGPADVDVQVEPEAHPVPAKGKGGRFAL